MHGCRVHDSLLTTTTPTRPFILDFNENKRKATALIAPNNRKRIGQMDGDVECSSSMRTCGSFVREMQTRTVPPHIHTHTHSSSSVQDLIFVLHHRLCVLFFFFRLFEPETRNQNVNRLIKCVSAIVCGACRFRLQRSALDEVCCIRHSLLNGAFAQSRQSFVWTLQFNLLRT